LDQAHSIPTSEVKAMGSTRIPAVAGSARWRKVLARDGASSRPSNPDLNAAAAATGLAPSSNNAAPGSAGKASAKDPDSKSKGKGSHGRVLVKAVNSPDLPAIGMAEISLLRGARDSARATLVRMTKCPGDLEAASAPANGT